MGRPNQITTTTGKRRWNQYVIEVERGAAKGRKGKKWKRK